MEMQGKGKICIITNAKDFKGGISAVVNGYRGSALEQDYNVHYVESCSDSKNKLKKVAKMLCGYFQFVCELVRFKPDVVHVNSSFGFSFYRKIFYICAGRAAGAKIVNHIHGAEFDLFYANASCCKKKLVQYIYRKCDVLVALSEEWKVLLKQIVPEHKVIVLENYSVLRRDEPKKAVGKTVLFLGEVGNRKGCCDIPQVVNKVVRSVPDCRFVLAGNWIEEDYAKIRADIDAFEISDYIDFPGWVKGEEKEELLQDADIFFLPSYNEGMPMSILDAMGYGIPIISTTVGGIPKIVRDGVNGYIREPGDVQGFAEKITELLLNQEKRKQFGMASLHIVWNGYSLESHIEKLEKIYEAVMSD